MTTVLATLASMFFGMSYTAPKPWCFVSVSLSAICVVLMRTL